MSCRLSLSEDPDSDIAFIRQQKRKAISGGPANKPLSNRIVMYESSVEKPILGMSEDLRPPPNMSSDGSENSVARPWFHRSVRPDPPLPTPRVRELICNIPSR